MAVCSVWIILTLLIMLQTHATSVKGVPTRNLHRHMTKRELEYYFNVDDHDKVPEYDVTSPYQSNDEGHFVSYSMHQTRTKRSDELHDDSFYKLEAFGSKLHLKLKRNNHLMAPDLKVLRESSDGTVTSHPAPENTFYLGQVASDPGSTVAVSNNGGLTGIVKTSSDTLFVHPLPAHLAKHVTSSDDATPHLVYRRSLKDDEISFEDDILYEATKDEENNHVRRSLETQENARKYYQVPKFKTLKVGYFCPYSLEEKYNNSKGNLNAVTGGVGGYVMLLANMVAGMYQDPSAGPKKLTYVVTNIIIIDPANYGINQTYDSNGQKLSRMTRKVVGDNQIKPALFDVFTYVSNKIAVGGLGTFKQICKYGRPTGNVNADVGLQTSLHIAHETGHNMGLDHDTGVCANGYIMSSSLPSGEQATEWSECSRNEIQRFLEDKDRSQCLDDGPVGDRPTLPPRFRNKLPGRVGDGDAQCEMQFGVGYKRHYRTLSNCKKLYCTRNGYDALSKSGVADGTKCRLNMWCIKGKCEHKGIGGWSVWSSYSSCTRECGGGVQYKTRHCNNPKPLYEGKNCQGNDKEYRICNPQACPVGTKDFRQMQCDEKSPGRLTYYLSRDACGLYCREGSSAKRFSTVDGTRCTLNEKDYSVCIQGKCRLVGCDHVLDSTTLHDRCGVCGGDGVTCTPQGSSPGYKWTTGSWSPCSRSCAVGIRKRIVRCIVIDDDSPASDSACPLPKLPIVEECNTQPCEAKWTYRWTLCSKTCGRGNQRRKLQCLEEVAPNDFRETDSCSTPKPVGEIDLDLVCNRYPCPAEWNIGTWSVCSTKCAIGVKRRRVLCSRIDEAGNFTIIDKEFCRYINQPPNETPCNEDLTCGPRPSACPDDHHCFNGGKCQPDPAGYKCVCDRGFAGLECEIFLKPCEKNPCLNGGTCSPGAIHHYDHTCKCPPLYTGRNCETKITACMSSPCLNGASCADNGDPDKYTCKCQQGFLGSQCQVSTFYRIGCFNHKQNVIPPLEDAKRQLTSKDTLNPAVIKCAEQAEEKGYKYFSVGLKGVCYSGPKANETYFTKGAAHRKKCGKGIGKKGASVVYTFEPVPSYEQLGCYRAMAKKKPKPLRTKYYDFRNQINSNKMITVDQCARVAKAKGYTYFAVQNNGQCVSDINAAQTYKSLGPSKKCVDGVGKKGANMVYRFNG